jgi:hypothetical protein
LYFVKSDLLVSSFLARAAAVSNVKPEEPDPLLLDLDIDVSLRPLEPDEYLLPELPL